MDYTRICRWLDMPSAEWPPDHYTLLGLKQGEQDCCQMEAQVQERLRRVRHYQLSHPELATEAMNRLAEAFACLSDAAARQDYNTQHGITALPLVKSKPSPENQAAAANTHASTDTNGTGMPTVVVWRAEAVPPPRPKDVPSQAVPPVVAPPETPAQPVVAAPPPATEPVPTPSASTDSAPAEAKDPILAAAERSWKAWKGLWSRSTLVERLGHTNALLRAWLPLGRFVNDKGALSANQRKNFRNRLARVDQLREPLPQLLGEPGQPGYRVAILAQDEDPIRAFRDMGPDERELLAQDWRRSATLLRSHIKFIEAELHQAHCEGFVGNWLRPLRAFVNNHASWLVGFLVSLVFLAGLWAMLHR